jgi:hypothetical protein
MFQFYFQKDNSFVIELEQRQYVIVENAYNATAFKN